MYSLKALAPKLGGFNAMRISAPLILNLSRNNGLALDLFILVMLVIFSISRMGLLLSCWSFFLLMFRIEWETRYVLHRVSANRVSAEMGAHRQTEHV